MYCNITRMAKANPWNYEGFKAYFREEDEEHWEEQVAAVLLLHWLRLVLEVDELALEAIPNGPIVNVVKGNHNVKQKNE